MINLVIITQSGSSFIINVDFTDTVLTIKHKIEMIQGIPVFKQTLSLEGTLLQDHLNIEQCRVLQARSPIFLSISPNLNTSDQEPQSSVASNPMGEFLGIDQDSTEVQSNQLLHQTEQSPLPDNPFGKNKAIALTTKKFCKDKVISVPARRIKNEYSPSAPAYSLDELLAPRDLQPVTIGSSSRNMDQVDLPVKKTMKTIPKKLMVFVQPFDRTWMIPVEVNANDNVEELRKELVKMQARGLLNLPPEGYYFKVSEVTLIETQSFAWNDVVEGDNIEIIRQPLTQA